MSRTNDELEDADPAQVAVHEAGHAVVAFLLGVSSIEMSLREVIFEGRALGGATNLSSSSHRDTNLWAGCISPIESIPIMLAGFLAERRVNPRRYNALKGAERDFEFVRCLDPFRDGPKTQGHRWLREMYPSPPLFQRFMFGQVRLTARLLRDNWRGVEGFAQLLLERGEVYPDQFLEHAAVLLPESSSRYAVAAPPCERAAVGSSHRAHPQQTR
jgi:hypothetical protein